MQHINQEIEEFYIRLIDKKDFNQEIISELKILKKFINIAKANINLKDSYNSSNLIKNLLDKESFSNGEYDNKNNKYIKSSLKAIEISIDFIENDLKRKIGNPDRIIIKRLIEDAGTIFEYCFEDLYLRTRKNRNQRFYYSYYKGVNLLYNLQTLMLLFCEDEFDNKSSAVAINSKLLYLSVDIRKQMELYFWSCLTGGKELKTAKGGYIKSNELFFKAVNKGHIAVKNEFLKKAFQFLGAVIHKKRIPEIYVILYIFKTLLDEYFNFEDNGIEGFKLNIKCETNESIKEFLIQQQKLY